MNEEVVRYAHTRGCWNRFRGFRRSGLEPAIRYNRGANGVVHGFRLYAFRCASGLQGGHEWHISFVCGELTMRYLEQCMHGRGRPCMEAREDRDGE